MIPCFKRTEKTEKIIREYSSFEKTEVLVSMQQYSKQFMSSLQDVFNKPNVHVIVSNKALPLGTIRKNMLKLVDVTQFSSVTIHDNDFILTEKDFILLETTMLQSSLNFSSPDFQNVCKDNKYQETRFGYGCITMDSTVLSLVVDKLSNVPANEDSELIYLLGNSGVAVNLNCFETKFSDATADAVIDNKNTKLQESSKFLQKKYGKHIVEILTRKSGKQFTIFTKYKPLILIVEGIDRSGKTSLIKKLDRITNYTFLMMDRGPVGYKTYGELYNKINRPEEYNLLEKQLCDVDHLCVYLYADNDTIINRFISTNEKPLPFGIAKNKQMYDKYYELSTLNKIKLDSGKLTVSELAEVVLQKIKEMQK